MFGDFILKVLKKSGFLINIYCKNKLAATLGLENAFEPHFFGKKMHDGGIVFCAPMEENVKMMFCQNDDVPFFGASKMANVEMMFC